MDAQIQFWTEWVKNSAAGGVNRGSERRGEYVLEAVRAITRPDMRILEIGCGSGWLSVQLAELGAVTAVDLPAQAIENLKRRRPDITWISGDFLELDLNECFDAVVSVETIAHVPDQQQFVRKIADLLVPGGTVVITTQNPPIWNRTRALAPPGQGQIRNWPSRQRLRQLLEPYFALRPVRTCAPSGDRGPLRLIHNRISESIARRILGEKLWTSAQERVGLGCSLVLVGTRNETYVSSGHDVPSAPAPSPNRIGVLSVKARLSRTRTEPPRGRIRPLPVHLREKVLASRLEPTTT